VTDPLDQTFSGFQGTRGTWMQFDCRAKTKDEAVAARKAVIAAMVPEAVVGGVTFQRAQEVRSRSNFERAGTGDVEGLFREMTEMTLWHNAA
jgi:hypothetical protein